MTHDLQESDIFVLLAKEPRRRTLRILRDTPTTLTAAELATRLATLQHECPAAAEIRTTYLGLYHNHLPRLDEADVLEYNPNQGTIRPGKNFDTVVRFLEGVTEEELPWSDS